MISLYGIPNCDTVKKARAWLDAAGKSYKFHDYKKLGVPDDQLDRWITALGWERLLNRAGTTWRKLDPATVGDVDEDQARALMLEYPSLIRRPVVEHPGGLLVGFKPAEWEAALG